MDDRNRFRFSARSAPYFLAVVISIISLIMILPEILDPSEGSYFYENVFYACTFVLLLLSLLLNEAKRSVLAIISCTSIFSLGLVGLFGNWDAYTTDVTSAQGVSPIAIDAWFEIILLGLFLVVVVVESLSLTKHQEDRI